MPRQSVADLLGEVDQAPPAAPPVVPPRLAPAEAVPAAAVEKPEPRRPAPRRVARGPRDTGTAGVTESQIPKWQRLERKELRLRADQLDELARIRRTLNRQRGGEGERITENTLIRVAVDMLLGRAGKLRGTTEDELRKSVTS
ncbi:MAG: hypothetical protein ACRDND_00105 [Streptosporangiaceae bacterium]